MIELIEVTYMGLSPLEQKISDRIRSGCNVKLLGDSLTIGSGSSDTDLNGTVIYPPFRRQKGSRCWASLLAAHLAQYGCKVDNVGCYGTTSDEMIEHLDRLYKPEEDAVVFCMIGANDKKVPNGTEHLRRNLEAVCDRIVRDGNFLILMTPNPATPANDAKPNRLYTQADVAKTIRTVAAEHADTVAFIDHFAAMTADCARSGLSMDEYLQVGAGPENDGLHPGDKVYRSYFDNICQALRI